LHAERQRLQAWPPGQITGFEGISRSSMHGVKLSIKAGNECEFCAAWRALYHYHPATWHFHCCMTHCVLNSLGACVILQRSRSSLPVTMIAHVRWQHSQIRQTFQRIRLLRTCPLRDRLDRPLRLSLTRLTRRAKRMYFAF